MRPRRYEPTTDSGFSLESRRPPTGGVQPPADIMEPGAPFPVDPGPAPTTLPGDHGPTDPGLC